MLPCSCSPVVFGESNASLGTLVSVAGAGGDMVQPSSWRNTEPGSIGNSPCEGTSSQEYIPWERKCLSNVVLRSTASLECLVACIFSPVLLWKACIFYSPFYCFLAVFNEIKHCRIWGFFHISAA